MNKSAGNKNNKIQEEILNLIANQEEPIGHLNNVDDNNEKNLIKNILLLENKSVEDVMVPRGEIVSVDNKSTSKSPHSIIVILFFEVKYSSPPIFKKSFGPSILYASTWLSTYFLPLYSETSLKVGEVT